VVSHLDFEEERFSSDVNFSYRWKGNLMINVVLAFCSVSFSSLLDC
jgi:hypothetical protein